MFSFIEKLLIFRNLVIPKLFVRLVLITKFLA